MRKLALLLGALAAAVLLAGCGEDAVSLDAVADAATNTGRAPTVRVAISGTTTSPQLPRPVSMTGEGAFDNRRRLGRMTLDMSDIASTMPAETGLDDPALWRGEEVVDFAHGAVIYMRFPFFAKALRTDKHWVRIDLEQVGRKMGFDLGQLTDLTQGNPTQQLDYLRAVSGDLERVGDEEVRGVETTHYRATVDLEKYPSLVPKSRRAAMKKTVDRLVELSGSSTYPVDVWVDDDELVRRMAFEMSMQKPQRMTVDTTIEYFGFGDAVDVSVPPVGDTYDTTRLMESQS